MPLHTHATHRIVVNAPADKAYMFFTPAGEELWVDGWAPRYVYPSDGTTQRGMVFWTGQGSDLTVWRLLDFDRQAMRSLYVRCTPASRMGTVEVVCTALEVTKTQVEVTYALTALSPEGESLLEAFEGPEFAAMIDGWASLISRNLPRLLAATIR
jgi:hypothetical protein